MTKDVTLRHDLRPGDLGLVAHYHGRWYESEFGYDYRFEGYVAKILGQFAEQYDPANDRLWIAEQAGQFAGCVAIIHQPDNWAQFRLFLIDPNRRGQGLGQRLTNEALAFCRSRGFSGVFLWTTADQTIAHRLYERFGFRLTEEKPPVTVWGQVLRERHYTLLF